VYFRPKTLAEATSTLAAERGRILSGGTDFFPALGESQADGPIIDISNILEINGIAVGACEVRIGAGTTWSDLVRAPLPPCFDGLRAAALQVGSVQIQNAGTIGGNICNASPAADGIPPLLALDARVELASIAGRRTLPLSRFLTGYRATERRPDEILAAIIVPRTIDQGRSAFLKLGTRRYMVISIAMVAAIIETLSGRVTQARMAIGSCSAVATRLDALEASLVDEAARPGLGAAALLQHLGMLRPIDDVRATASYRMDAALTLVRRAIETCVADDR
jgi:CO/xanthine dehydrogenase FAD-binding subunit